MGLQKEDRQQKQYTVRASVLWSPNIFGIPRKCENEAMSAALTYQMRVKIERKLMLYTLKQILKKTHEYEMELIMLFVCFKQAFDNLQ